MPIFFCAKILMPLISNHVFLIWVWHFKSPSLNLIAPSIFFLSANFMWSLLSSHRDMLVSISSTHHTNHLSIHSMMVLSNSSTHDNHLVHFALIPVLSPLTSRSCNVLNVQIPDAHSITASTSPRFWPQPLLPTKKKLPERWDDVRIKITRPGPVDQSGPCANVVPQDDVKAASLPPGEVQYHILGPVPLYYHDYVSNNAEYMYEVNTSRMFKRKFHWTSNGYDSCLDGPIVVRFGTHF